MRRFLPFVLTIFFIYVPGYITISLFIDFLWGSKTIFKDVLVESLYMGAIFTFLFCGMYWYIIRDKLEYLMNDEIIDTPAFQNIQESHFHISPASTFQDLCNQISKSWKIEFLDHQNHVLKFRSGFTNGAYLRHNGENIYLITFPMVEYANGQTKRAKEFNEKIRKFLTSI